MEQRYSLRFETDERHGETVPIPLTGLTVGRRPGHALQLLDASVSGKHAELVVDGNGVLLRDLASTNGTRVGDERVLEARLAHGDVVAFGNVKLTFLDAQIDEVAAVARVPSHSAQPAHADALQRVSPEKVARSKKVSRPGIFLVAIVLLGGGVWWWLHKSGRSGAPVVSSVEPVPGNLLAASYSFEGGAASESEGAAWLPHADAPVAFQRSAQAGASGDFGLAADLDTGEWAAHRSPLVRAETGGGFRLRGVLRASGSAIAALGVEYARTAAPEEGSPAAVIAWTVPIDATGAGEPRAETSIDASVSAPPGYDGARAIVCGWASGAGTVSVDDVSLVAQPGDASLTLRSGDHQLTQLGSPPTAANLFRVDRALITSLRFGDEEPVHAFHVPGSALAASAGEGRLSIEPADTATAPTSLRLRAEPALVRGGIATIAADGYRNHGLDFEREEVTSLLLGSGRELVRLAFSEPVAVRGRQDGPASAIVARAPSPRASGIGAVQLQLDFKEERTKAGDLAHAARNAEKRAALGEALAQWSALLDGFPFEEALVAEAERSRGRLIQQGLAELRAVRAEVERARFFRLVDLFRQCRDKALAVGARYAPSEVEVQARDLAGEVEVVLTDLEADLDHGERERLTAILRALEAEKAEGLAGEVRAYLESELGAAK